MSLCLLAACSEADDIRDRIDRQNERLAALENLVEQVNGNVLAISALFDESILIADFREKTDSDGTVIGYVLELSDGQQIEVTFGDELDPLVPVIGVDEEGRFIYSMDGGETFQPVEGAGKATSTDGITPKIELDADGYWTVSVDGGQTWTRTAFPSTPFRPTARPGTPFLRTYATT